MKAWLKRILANFFAPGLNPNATCVMCGKLGLKDDMERYDFSTYTCDGRCSEEFRNRIS